MCFYAKNNFFDGSIISNFFDTCTIAAKDNNKGVVGVAPDAQIISGKVFFGHCQGGFSSDIMSAARECKRQGAKIINMSLGGT